MERKQKQQLWKRYLKGCLIRISVKGVKKGAVPKSKVLPTMCLNPKKILHTDYLTQQLLGKLFSSYRNCVKATKSRLTAVLRWARSCAQVDPQKEKDCWWAIWNGGNTVFVLLMLMKMNGFGRKLMRMWTCLPFSPLCYLVTFSFSSQLYKNISEMATTLHLLPSKMNFSLKRNYSIQDFFFVLEQLYIHHFISALFI